MRKYRKNSHGENDFYENEFYKIRMVESKAILIPNGPDDADVDWEVGKPAVCGVNTLTTKEFNKAYEMFIKGWYALGKTYFTNEDIVKEETVPGQTYLYRWEDSTNRELHIDVLKVNVPYKVDKSDMEAIAAL